MRKLLATTAIISTLLLAGCDATIAANDYDCDSAATTDTIFSLVRQNDTEIMEGLLYKGLEVSTTENTPNTNAQDFATANQLFSAMGAPRGFTMQKGMAGMRLGMLRAAPNYATKLAGIRSRTTYQLNAIRTMGIDDHSKLSYCAAELAVTTPNPVAMYPSPVSLSITLTYTSQMSSSGVYVTVSQAHVEGE